MKKLTFKFEVNGFQIQADYSEESIRTIWKPLLRKLTEIQEIKKDRILVYLVAPPAVGKSTLAFFLEYLSTQMSDVKKIQSIGLDGFHYSQEYILEHTVMMNGKETPMKDVKGCPETFNIDKIKSKLIKMKTDDIKWPIYDRNLHDVVDDQIDVNNNIVLIEGNWLLLKDDKWKELKSFCDYSIFIDAKEDTLKDRLIQRKVTGGLSLEEAMAFYKKSDSKNVIRVKEYSQCADLEIYLLETGDYSLKEGMCNTHE